MTNLGLKDGEKTDIMSKRNLKIINNKNVCKSEAGCINEQTNIVMCIERIKAT